MEIDAGCALIDAGDGRRLERFGDRIVDRPAPGADVAPQDRAAWSQADLVFDRAGGWTSARDEALEPWTIDVGNVRLELRPTATGQLGLFPEQLAQLGWLTTRVRERSGDAAPEVLNLFAYTGLATLALAAAGAAVVHLDGSRPTVAWARRNAELSALTDRPIRWLVDGVPAFIAREARRGRRYGGIVLDPPSYGHGAEGRRWLLVRDLPELLEACRRVLAPNGFVLLTAHTPDVGPDDLADLLGRTLGRPPASIERGALELEAESGAGLALGAFARSAG